MDTNLRAVVIGASSLLGKELIDELNASQSAWELRLADTGEGTGQLVAGGEEALLVHPLSPDIFDGRDVAFFAADPETVHAHWREAQTAGAAIVDLAASLEDQPRAIVTSAWIANGPKPASDTAIVIPAHPAALMLGVLASRLSAAFSRVHLAATVLEPASQQGSRGMDEMHQQTVSLLGFHSLPQEVYDAQVAFNLRVSVGEAATVDMGQIAATIRRHLNLIAGDTTAASVAFQLVQAPVFHGYTMSVYAELPADAEPSAVRRALSGDLLHLTTPTEAPNNQSVTQEPGISIALTEDAATPGNTRGYWLWMAADNLKLAARHAVACAEQFAAVRATRTSR
ncbi:MAG TPA: Asd/ArgC dimerization domain-containing protein [Acidobacteriaceae bacterium]|jgi:aspartate-semialdehyde dehydrogenase